MLLDDAQGSVRGVTDEAGDLVGNSNYDVYGEVRASSGVSTLFRYTGEQLDAETGFTYLRARYLNSPLARFTSADAVQPNAPGTQGYNLYAYVANNPTTWIDPSGNAISDPITGFWRWFNNPSVYAILFQWSLDVPVASAMIGFTVGSAITKNPTGVATGIAGIGFGVVTWLLGKCLSDPACLQNIQNVSRTLTDFASPGNSGGSGSKCREDIPSGPAEVGDVYVYVSRGLDGTINYVGITNDLDRRQNEHIRAGRNIEIDEIDNLGPLTRKEARAVEEALIKDGVAMDSLSDSNSLLNKIHSISPRNACYAEWVDRGLDLLDAAGFVP